ncbi:hypothetical protein FA15DRAFT_474178, partial [Coprinopsis marcescibilis]
QFSSGQILDPISWVTLPEGESTNIANSFLVVNGQHRVQALQLVTQSTRKRIGLLLASIEEMQVSGLAKNKQDIEDAKNAIILHLVNLFKLGRHPVKIYNLAAVHTASNTSDLQSRISSNPNELGTPDSPEQIAQARQKAFWPLFKSGGKDAVMKQSLTTLSEYPSLPASTYFRLKSVLTNFKTMAVLSSIKAVNAHHSHPKNQQITVSKLTDGVPALVQDFFTHVAEELLKGLLFLALPEKPLINAPMYTWDNNKFNPSRPLEWYMKAIEPAVFGSIFWSSLMECGKQTGLYESFIYFGSKANQKAKFKRGTDVAGWAKALQGYNKAFADRLQFLSTQTTGVPAVDAIRPFLVDRFQAVVKYRG